MHEKAVFFAFFFKFSFCASLPLQRFQRSVPLFLSSCGVGSSRRARFRLPPRRRSRADRAKSVGADGLGLGFRRGQTEGTASTVPPTALRLCGEVSELTLWRETRSLHHIEGGHEGRAMLHVQAASHGLSLGLEGSAPTAHLPCERLYLNVSRILF